MPPRRHFARLAHDRYERLRHKTKPGNGTIQLCLWSTIIIMNIYTLYSYSNPLSSETKGFSTADVSDGHKDDGSVRQNTLQILPQLLEMRTATI